MYILPNRRKKLICGRKGAFLSAGIYKPPIVDNVFVDAFFITGLAFTGRMTTDAASNNSPSK